jgi:hypothetical protein
MVAARGREKSHVGNIATAIDWGETSLESRLGIAAHTAAVCLNNTRTHAATTAYNGFPVILVVRNRVVGKRGDIPHRFGDITVG